METAKLFPLHIQQSKTKKKKAVWLSLKVVHTDAYSGSRKIKKLKKKKNVFTQKKKKRICFEWPLPNCIRFIWLLSFVSCCRYSTHTPHCLTKATVFASLQPLFRRSHPSNKKKNGQKKGRRESSNLQRKFSE